MPEVRILRSLDELSQHADQWNALWTSSAVASPLARAEMVQWWFEALADPAQFRAVVVEQQQRWVAALPLRIDRAGPLRVGRLPRHPWSNCGDLLLHPSHTSTEIARELLGGLRQLPISGLWFDDCPLEREDWNTLSGAVAASGATAHQEYQHSVGFVRLLDDHSRYQAGLSKNHRKKLRQATTRAKQLGALRLSSILGGPDDRWRKPFQLGLKVEDANWKGEQGSSILKTPGMASYFERLAELLADGDFLELLFLTAGDEVMAFELGYTAKGVYVSHKVGFDDRFASYSPGHLLMNEQIREFHADASHLAIDCLSAVTPPIARWVNQAEPRYRLLVGLHPWLGSSLINGYRFAAGTKRKLRKTEPYVCPPIAADVDGEHLKRLDDGEPQKPLTAAPAALIAGA